MDSPGRTYPSDGITVQYDARRCIHFAACVRGLPDVFDPDQRPWIQPDEGSADAIAAVVQRCPTGALHFTRTDGGPEEQAPTANTVAVAANGPFYVHGDLALETPEGEVVLRDTRVALCRCGRSKRKPFCDNSHLDGVPFEDAGALGTPGVLADSLPSGPLRITLRANGSLGLAGPVTLAGADGQRLAMAKASLCRCGGSANKPFCDGSHRHIGFSTVS